MKLGDLTSNKMVEYMRVQVLSNSTDMNEKKAENRVNNNEAKVS